jgi:hypothetical protein
LKRIVRIVSDNHHYDHLLRQWDQNASYAKEFEVTMEAVEECDFLIVLEYPKSAIRCRVPEENVWVWSMEPPDEEWEWLRKCYRYFDKVVTIDKNIVNPGFIQQQLAIPWQIEFGYDELQAMDVFEKKTKDLSFITSNYAARKGHRKRLTFLNKIKDTINFDLYGRGFAEIKNKSEALLPYKYSIVVENSRYPDYWSEKLADAYLCGALPFYSGCINAGDYFDSDAFIKIDISKPEQAIEIMRSAIKSNEWEKRKNAIAKARKKIMDEYQFFPVMAKLINTCSSAPAGNKQEIIIPALEHHASEIKPYSLHRVYYRIKKFFLKKAYNDPHSKFFGYVTYK